MNTVQCTNCMLILQLGWQTYRTPPLLSSLPHVLDTLLYHTRNLSSISCMLLSHVMFLLQTVHSSDLFGSGFPVEKIWAFHISILSIFKKNTEGGRWEQHYLFVFVKIGAIVFFQRKIYQRHCANATSLFLWTFKGYIWIYIIISQ